MQLRSIVNSVASNTVPFEIVWSSHPAWPLPPIQPLSNGASSRPLVISCLDSSFNPPTVAHLAMASAPLPSPLHQGESSEYDGHLLLLSVKNVEKVLKDGDASYEQRLKMMVLLAKHMQEKAAAPSHQNIGVGILSEPAFVGKDKIVRDFLAQRPSAGVSPMDLILAWLIGSDTLVRFFDQRFYQSPLRSALSPFFTPKEHSPSFLVHFPRVPAPPPSDTADETIAASLPTGSIRDSKMGRDGVDRSEVSSTVVRGLIKGSENDWRDLVAGRELADWLEKEELYR